ncbi:MAG: multicopper oxidase domain-containing protein [Ignavibacteria bacterium]|nr:multicopper oxidase domain-containing protein [Ignavibacteria bacterium]
MNLLRFDITGNTGSGGIIPAALPPINYYSISDVKTTRTFTLTMIMGGMNMHRINGLTFEMNRIDWETPQNSLEEWRIINASNMLHPMHSHSEQFQVYSRNGSTILPPEDKGSKDTVLINRLRQSDFL